jgi:hypothetical protein
MGKYLWSIVIIVGLVDAIFMFLFPRIMLFVNQIIITIILLIVTYELSKNLKD